MKNKKDVEPASYASFEMGRGKRNQKQAEPPCNKKSMGGKKTYFAFCYWREILCWRQEEMISNLRIVWFKLIYFAKLPIYVKYDNYFWHIWGFFQMQV